VTAPSFSVAGKTALVTGASRGLGRAIAVALAGAGADVVCHSVRRKGTDETAARIRALGRRAWQVECDLTARPWVLDFPEEVEREAGPVHILVNNAGMIHRAPAAEHAMADFDDVMAANTDAVFILCRYFGGRMVERGSGKIINLASLLSFSGGLRVPAYTASKHAVAGLTKALANEWARHGVQVNAIAPGYFSTDNTQPLRDDAARNAEITARIPAGRWGEPEDLAGAVVFLASPASDYVNGHVLVVDGGWMAR
jgi:2-deoxy-D-gluconate 3-dehydrogenase